MRQAGPQIAPTGLPTTATPHEWVKVTNTGQEEFRDMYASTPYRIPPGAAVVVPWHAATNWCGDPWLRNVGDKRHRDDEYARLRTRYGAYNKDDVWEANRPKVEVYDLNDERVLMVVDDPSGNLSEPPSLSGDQGQYLLEYVERQQKQIDAMRAQLQGQIDTGEVSVPDDDTPQQIPVGPRNPGTGGPGSKVRR